ncbi:MAG TPA: molybdenum cofactor biosynthesis protein MoaE [Chthoniobacterales bacterium]
MLTAWDTKLTRQPLLVPAPDFTRTDGAVVDFFGVVRDVEDGRRIEGIEYEAFAPMAERLLAEIAQEAVELHRVGHVVLHHRIGFVPAGEASLFLRVFSERRKAAFRASESLVERLKELVPIWKHPVYATVQVA